MLASLTVVHAGRTDGGLTVLVELAGSAGPQGPALTGVAAGALTSVTPSPLKLAILSRDDGAHLSQGHAEPQGFAVEDWWAPGVLSR